MTCFGNFNLLKLLRSINFDHYPENVYAISRQLIIYRDKSSLLLQSSSRRLPGVFLWLLGDWWLQDRLESAAEATRPPCSAGVGMLAG